MPQADELPRFRLVPGIVDLVRHHDDGLILVELCIAVVVLIRFQKSQGPRRLLATAGSAGLLITIAGILVISPDSLLIRLIAMDIWSTSAWRGGMQALGLSPLPLLLRDHAQLVIGRGLAVAIIELDLDGGGKPR